MGVRKEKSSKTCLYAYLNEYDPEVYLTEYEAWSMGMFPLQMRLPENWACHLYQQRASAQPYTKAEKSLI